MVSTKPAAIAMMRIQPSIQEHLKSGMTALIRTVTDNPTMTKMAMAIHTKTMVATTVTIPMQVYKLAHPKSGMTESIKTVTDCLTMTKTTMVRILQTTAERIAMTVMAPSVQVKSRFGTTASIRTAMV